MSQPLRIENPDAVFFITSRTIASRLWFINNSKLEERILAYLAKYQTIYEVEIFGFVMMGNHYHLIAKFPKGNKASFMRAFNAMVAKLVNSMVASFDGGRLWARRYAEQSLPRPEDVEHWFFYCSLNPVLAGLCERISDYKSFNSFVPAVNEREREYKVFESGAYQEALRLGKKVKPEDFLRSYKLRFSRLPGYDVQAQSCYRAHMMQSLETRRQIAVKEREKLGKGFAPCNMLQSTKPGSLPKSTKRSDRYSFRPLVLTLCKKTKRRFLQTYFKIKDAFQKASEMYRKGFLEAEFPCGTYRPVVHTN